MKRALADPHRLPDAGTRIVFVLTGVTLLAAACWVVVRWTRRDFSVDLPAALATAAILLGALAAVLYRDNRRTREKEEAMETLLRRMINAFAIFDSVFDERGVFVSYRFVYVNDAYERITGVRLADAKGMTIHEVWPGTEPDWIKACGDVAVSGVPREFDMYHAPTAKLYHCCVYLPGADRNRFCVIFEDITERRRSEESVQRERNSLQAMLNASPVGMLVFDEREEILFANPAAEVMFATAACQLTRRRCGDFIRCINSDTAPGGCGTSALCPACELAAAVRGALAGNGAAASRQGEILASVKGGPPLWLGFKSNPVVVNGRRCAVLALDNTTESKRAGEQIRTLLAESNQARLALLGILEDETRAEADRKRLATAIEQAAEVIVVTDAQGTIQYVNPAFESVTGFAREEAIGRNPRILQSGQHDAAFYRALWATVASGKTWQGRFVNRRKDGTPYTEEATISPVHDTAGAIINYVAVKRDLTEHLRLQAQLVQAQKLESIGTLAGGVAHEINNPIMGIMNYAQLILDRLGADHPVAEFAVEIGKETERVATIVRNLLSFARFDREQRSSARPCDIVTGTLSLVRAIMRHDQITLDVEVPEDLPPISCRSQHIQQVLMNLLTNARDALNERYPQFDENKKVRLTARIVGPGPERDEPAAATGDPSTLPARPHQLVRVTIEDHGAGIPEDLRVRIFDPFFTTKARDKGTGLGLSISHGIVKDHGGQLWVESEVGQWTRFHVDLPLA